VFWHLTYDEGKRLIYFDTATPFTLSTIRAVAVSVAEIQEYADPIGFLVDLTRSDVHLLADEIKRLPEYFNQIALERHKLRTAVVLPAHNDNHALLLLKLVYRRNGIETELFADREEAVKWLESW
jgi:hypothetical protein